MKVALVVLGMLVGIALVVVVGLRVAGARRHGIADVSTTQAAPLQASG